MREGVDASKVRNKFACPDCGGDLKWERRAAKCVCGSSFPIVHGVLQIEPASGAQAEYFARAWRESRPTTLSIETRRRLNMFKGALAGSILEIGAGDAVLARTHPDLDIVSSDLVLEGIADLGPRAAAFPLHRFPFKPRSFDTVVAFEVLEHLSPVERKQAIVCVERVLRPGGLFLLSVPTWPIAWLEWLLKAVRYRVWPRENNLEDWDFPHQIRFRAGQLELELNGFEVVGARCWARSGSVLGLYLVNPLLRTVRLPGIDLGFIDAAIPFDNGSNQVVLARKPGG